MGRTQERFEVSFRALDGTALHGAMRHTSTLDGTEVALTDEHGVVVATLQVAELARADRFLQVPNSSRPGRVLDIGPVDVARLKSLPTMHLYTRAGEQNRQAG